MLILLHELSDIIWIGSLTAIPADSNATEVVYFTQARQRLKILLDIIQNLMYLFELDGRTKAFCTYVQGAFLHVKGIGNKYGN